MPTPSYSIVFWAKPVDADTEITVGKVVIPDSDDPDSWVVSTTANRGSRRSEGIAISASSEAGLGAFEIQQTGTIDASISGLGSAVGRSLVRCSATGTCERIATASVDPSTDDILGVAEEDGRVHLYIGFPFEQVIAIVGERGPRGWYDVTDYGATGDGVTDDRAAVMSAIAAMGSGAAGAVLYFPPGTYRMGGNLDVYKQIEVRGVGGGVGNGKATLEFDPGFGIVVWNLGSPYGGNGSGSAVRHICMTSSFVTQPEWQATTAYSVGDIVHIGDRDCNWVYLKCMVAGTSAGTSPDPGYDHDPSAAFVAGASYGLRQLVRGTGITSAVFEVTTAGTAGASEPTWDTTIGDTTTSGTVTFTARSPSQIWITDGTVVWSQQAHNGIRLQARADVYDVYIEGFTNAGFSVRSTSGTPFTNANGWTSKDVRIVQCGMGHFVSGSDSNVGTAINTDVESAGYEPGVGWMPGNGGIGIWDSSFLGCTWVGCHVANGVDLATYNGGGAAYKGGGGASYAVFTGCYSESYASRPEIASDISTPAIVTGGNHGAGFVGNPSAMMLFDPASYGARNIIGKTAKSGGGYLYSYIGSVGGGANVFRWASSSDAYYMSLSYSTALGGGWPASWWVHGHNETEASSAFAIPGEGAVWPSGASVGTYAAAWFPMSRFHLGPYSTDPQSIGVGSAAPAAGYHVRGSLVLNTGWTGISDPIGWMASATGTPGTWSAIYASSATPAPADATYVTLSTNSTLTNERALTAGTGITVTDGGAGGNVTVAAPGMAAQFVVLSATGDLANERVLTAGTGISITDGGAGGNVTIASTSAITGTDTRVLFFDGNDNPAGDAGFTYNKTTDSATLAGSIALNSSAATTGAVKLAGTGNTAQVVWHPGSDDHTIIATDSSGSGQVTFGASTLDDAVVQGQNESALAAAGSRILRVFSDAIRAVYPLGGSFDDASSLSFLECSVLVASSGDTTLTDTEAACVFIYLTGTVGHGPDVNFPTPGRPGAFWFVENACTGGVYLTVGSSDILLAAGDKALVTFTSNGGWQRWI